MSITGGQIRAARGFLQWTAVDLARNAKLGLSTVRRAEDARGFPPLTAANLEMIRRTLEAAGVVFIAQNGMGPGVRLREREREREA